MRPLRPFSLPLSIGTDICQISRIYAILSSPRRQRFVERVLTAEERAGQDQRLEELRSATGASADEPTPSGQDAQLWSVAAYLAGRFAAKEAAIKAHTHRRLTFHDIIVERQPTSQDMDTRLGSGPPIARIRAPAGSEEADQTALVSISHDGDYATAVCLAQLDP